MTPKQTLTRASHRRLQRGDILINELEANWAGYRSQEVQPVCVGECDPTYTELMRMQGEVLSELLPQMKPGVTIGELAVAPRQVVHAARRLIGGRPPRAESLRAVL